jgi:hypothetical protein
MHDAVALATQNEASRLISTGAACLKVAIELNLKNQRPESDVLTGLVTDT